jgi:hypothetical protein
MEWFFGAALVILVILVGCWLIFKTMDSFLQEKVGLRWILLAVTIGFWAAVIGFIAKTDAEQKAKGPCVQYETQMHFNPATKTMMPAKVCVNRGEWVNE